MAIERANNGNVPVDALLGALRRAAEEDGVDDVDAVVAEFATFVRAQAPQLASAPSARRQGTGWTTAMLAAGALTTAAFGAVASGLVANPLIDTGSSGSSGTVAAEAAPATTLPVDGPAAREPSTDRALNVTAPMLPLDPDALAVIEAQQSEADGAVPVLSTSPTPTDPAPASSNSPTSNSTSPNSTSPASTSPTSTSPTSTSPTSTSPTSTTSTTLPGSDAPSDDGPGDGPEDGSGQDGNEDSGDGDGDGGDVIEPMGATAADPGSTDGPLQPLEMPHEMPHEMPREMPSATVASLDDQGGVA